jgi:flagellar basal-body rod protein FlgG
MNDSLYIAATGMQAQQMTIDSIANNLANVATAGFKKGRVAFQEMMHADPAGAGARTPSVAGLGIAVANITRDFTPGTLAQTGAQMDLAIDGTGFIEVALADGSRGYTRGGTLSVSKDSYLATADGLVLKPAIHIPQGTTAIRIGGDGKVSVQAGAGAAPVEVGQIELANFANPSALSALSGNVYMPTEASGEAMIAKPGNLGLGQLVQGSLENSNVNLTDEMVTLVVAQRAYEMSSKVIQASDELMSLTNNLRR